MQRSLLRFENAIKSESTRKSYRYQLQKFLGWAKVPEADGLLKLSDSDLELLLEDYLFYKKTRISPNSIPLIFSPLELFFGMNDKNVNFKKLRKMFPAKVKRSGYAAWSNEDARKILDGAKGYRNKALVHVLASTGCRLGAIPTLKVGHVSDMQGGCKAILLYEGSNEEYYGFLTPEASKALDEYLERRKQDGEKVGIESPLFRLHYRIGSAKVEPLNMIALQATMVNIMKYARPKRHKVGIRYNIQLDHGFRKRFATIIKMDKKISWAVGEKLLGHKTYLDAEYFNPTKENLFAEFQKVVFNLTIDDSERNKITIHDLKQHNSTLQVKTAEIPEMKKQIEHDHLIVQVLAKTMKEIGINFEYPDGTPYKIDENLKIPAEYLPETVAYDKPLVAHSEEIFRKMREKNSTNFFNGEKRSY
ncbi:MAG: tyrosine-type recombinase/integrase [Nitrosopumilaceae archaeon]